MFQNIVELNKNYQIQLINQDNFMTYGCIVEINVDDAIEYADKCVHPPKNGNQYRASVKEIESLASIRQIALEVYGGMNIIAGSVVGDNTVLNGIEFHQGSETIIAVEDFIYVVGHRWDMKNNQYDTSLCQIFYVPRGTVIESYATTLHYAPIQVSDRGFKTICILPQGTGDCIEKRVGILKKKNKWFIAHGSNVEKIESGDYPGLIGDLIQIKYK